MTRILICASVAALSIGLVGCEPAPTPLPGMPPAPRVNSTAYYECIKRGADAGVRSVVKDRSDFVKVDLDQIAREVLADCANKYSNAVPLQHNDLEYTRIAAQDVLTAVMREDREHEIELRKKQTELDLAKMKTTEDAAATRQYGDCLIGHTRVLALRSSEPAATVVQAALASCARERAAILDVHRRYHDDLVDEEVMKMADDKIIPNLLLEVIQVRSALRPPSAPAPSPPKTPPPPPDQQS